MQMNEAKKNSILMIDDESSNIIALTAILEEDYTVYAVIDSLEAVETAEEGMPDIILLDVLMPEMDGYDVITALKQSEKARNIPVIFITGLDSKEAEEKGLALGAADYISKPFNPAIVRMRVQNQMKILEQYRTIERISLHDQLTGLPNRRSFENRLDLEWNTAVREQKPISLLMIDVDKFKDYNDTHGHQEGDLALISVTGGINKALKRSVDFAARWGGEEFIVLLPNTDSNGAIDVAEQIRSGIAGTEIIGKSITKVTVSVGASTLTDCRDSTIDAFISEADEALYAAKREGRNMVCLYERE